MSQQLPPSPKTVSLRKSILITGILLMISSFFFFYLSSRIDFDYTTTYRNTVNISGAGTGIHPYEFGNLSHFPFSPLILMEPNDYITVSYDTVTNGTVYLVLWHYDTNPTVLKYANYGFLDHKAPEQTLVEIYLASENPNNVIPTTVTLHHYERPQWLFFGLGAVLASLGLVSVFKTKR
jgi:hypothetical protein